MIAGAVLIFFFLHGNAFILQDLSLDTLQLTCPLNELLLPVINVDLHP